MFTFAGSLYHHSQNQRSHSSHSGIDYYDGYGHNYKSDFNEGMFIGGAVVVGLILMVMIFCICLIISFVAGGFVHKWYNQSIVKKGARRKQSKTVNKDDHIDHSQI